MAKLEALGSSGYGGSFIRNGASFCQAQKFAAESPGGVAGNLVFFHEVSSNALNTEGLDGVAVTFHLAGVLFGISFQHAGRDGSGVDQRVIKNPAAGVVEDCPNVLGGSHVQAFVGLGHQVANENFDGAGGGYGFRDALNNHVGNQAGEQRPGSNGDDVRMGNRFQGLGQRPGVWRNHMQFDNTLLTGCDVGFTADARAIVHEGLQFDVGGGGGKNVASGSQDFRGELDSVRKISSNGGERGQK